MLRASSCVVERYSTDGFYVCNLGIDVPFVVRLGLTPYKDILFYEDEKVLQFLHLLLLLAS